MSMATSGNEVMCANCCASLPSTSLAVVVKPRTNCPSTSPCSTLMRRRRGAVTCCQEWPHVNWANLRTQYVYRFIPDTCLLWRKKSRRETSPRVYAVLLRIRGGGAVVMNAAGSEDRAPITYVIVHYLCSCQLHEGHNFSAAAHVYPCPAFL